MGKVEVIDFLESLLESVRDDSMIITNLCVHRDVTQTHPDPGEDCIKYVSDGTGWLHADIYNDAWIIK